MKVQIKYLGLIVLLFPCALLADSSLTFCQNQYECGWRAYKLGDKQEARNFWYKYKIASMYDDNFVKDSQFKNTLIQLELLNRELTSGDIQLSTTVAHGLIQSSGHSRRVTIGKQKSRSRNYKLKSLIPVAEILVKAKRLEKSGQFDDAYDLVEIALKVDPNNKEAKEDHERLMKIVE